MRVAIVAGVARSLINFRGLLIKSVLDKGHEVIACAPNSPKEVVDVLEGWGVEYQEVPINRTGMNPLHDFMSFYRLRSLFRRLIPDVVLAYTIKPVIYGSLAAKSVGVSRTYSMITGLGYSFTGNSPKQKLVSTIVQRLYRQALQSNETVFFQNPDDKSLFIEKSLVRVEQSVITNGSGVDVDHYTKAPPVLDKKVFLLIARLLRDKGIYEFVEAARRIKNKHSDVVFRLVGPFDSNPSAIAKETINDWVHEGIIEYLGAVKDVRPYIADASVYVLPSYREGTPRTVLEAMAMGRPIITTDAPGCRETVIHGKNGYLVPVRNVDQLVDAMERFVKDPSLIAKMGDESYDIAIQKYDAHKVNKQILEVMGL